MFFRKRKLKENKKECDQSNKISFDSIKDKLMEELKKRSHLLNIEEPVTLIDGFINPMYHHELDDRLHLMGPNIPMIMLLGEHTARIYLLSPKALLPDMY
jgi:hypothetical protein